MIHPFRRSRSQSRTKVLGKFKSLFEKQVAEQIGDAYEYEPDRISFTQPEKKRTYTPDFRVREGVYIECKGLLSVEDRSKMLWVKEQHPELTFYLLFQNASVKLRRGGKTTYGDWATANGFKWADFRSGIPSEWFEQKTVRRVKRVKKDISNT